MRGVACHNGSVPEWLRVTCWNVHREARAISAQNTRNNGSLMYTNIRIHGMDGKGWGGGGGGVWDRFPMISRVSL